MIRTAITTVALIIGTLIAGLAAVARWLGIPDRRGGLYDIIPQIWARMLLGAAGVRVIKHGAVPLEELAPRVYVSNHVSWFDIPSAIRVLWPFGFVAKRELERYPVFGAAARALHVIFIDRENRKAAFAAYEDASAKIRAGQSVLVFPEGTRGRDYRVRPFKKGPFVLAIGSGAPIVPVVIHGTIAVNPRGKFRAGPGTVHVHVLDPIPTEGLTYDDRSALAEQVRQRMAECLQAEYGVTPLPSAAGSSTEDAASTD